MKCDKIKPVCLTCVKHGTNLECSYEYEKKEVRFVPVKSTNFSSKVKKSTATLPRKDFSDPTVAKELDFLKKKLQSLESLLKKPDCKAEIKSPKVYLIPVEDQLNIEEKNYEIYEKYGELNFYDNLQTVDVRGGRLSFNGAMNYVSLSKVDPYLMVITTLIRKYNSETYKLDAEKKTIMQKYAFLEYVPQYAKEALIGLVKEKFDPPNAMVQLRNYEAIKSSALPSTELSTEDDTEKENIANFEKKYLENESLDGIIYKERRDKVSLVDILNENGGEAGACPEELSAEKTPRSKSETKPSKASLWRQLPQILAQSETIKESHRLAHFFKGDGIMTSGREGLEILLYIKKLLPPAKLLWIHLDNYFNSVLYALYPFSTEDWYLDSVSSVFGERSDSESPPTLKIDKKLDLAKIGSVFAILRLSYLMYPKSLDQCSSEEEKYVLQHEIGIEYIEVTQLCLNQFNLLRRGLLPVLQCSILLRLYRRFAPEEGDIAESGDTNTLTGLLVQTALSLGMNIDADVCFQLTNFEIYLHSWRKLWYTIYFLDLSEAMNMGNCFSIDVDEFKTKLPTIKSDHQGEIPSFFIHKDLELATVDCYRQNFEFSLSVRDLMKMVMNKRVGTSCITILKKVDEIRSYLKADYAIDMGTLFTLPIDTKGDSVKKCNKFITYVNTNSMLLMVYSRIFIHMDEVDKHGILADKFEVPISILKKCLSIYVELEPVLVLLYHRDLVDEDKTPLPDKIFGKGSKMIILQCCEHFFIRFQTILHLLLSRLVHLYHNFLKSPETHALENENLERIRKLTLKIIEVALEKLGFSNSITEILSGKQFQAWRVSKGNKFYYSIFSDVEDNIFDLQSRSNIEFQRLIMMLDSVGSPLLPDDLNPVAKLPKYNNFIKLDVVHFEEMYSILNSTKWSILCPYMTEQELEDARSYRCSLRNRKKVSKKARRTTKSRKNGTNKSNFKERNMESALGKNENVSPSNLTDSGSDSVPSSSQVPINEIDTHWLNDMLRKNNLNLTWASEQVDKNNKPANATTVTTNPFYSPILINTDGSLSETFSGANVGLDEMFQNSTSLHEQAHLQSHQRGPGPAEIGKAEIERPLVRNNFSMFPDSYGLDYLLFNGEI